MLKENSGNLDFYDVKMKTVACKTLILSNTLERKAKRYKINNKDN